MTKAASMSQFPLTTMLLKLKLKQPPHRRPLSTVVDLSHLSSSATSPTIPELSNLSKSTLLSKYTVSPPITSWPRRPSPKLIARLIRRHSDPALCLRIFHHAANFVPDFSHNYESYHALIDRLARARSHSPIPSLLSSLRNSSIPCGEQLFITLINSYSLASRPNHSLKIFLSIPTYGVKTSVRAFNALLNAMIRNKRYDVVPVLFNNCRAKFNILPNVFTCNILLKALCEIGDIDAVLKVLDEMPEWGMLPNVVTYTTIISLYCARGDLEAALALLDEARNKGLEPDVRTYTVLIDGYCRANKLVDAAKIMDDMERNGIAPNEATYSIVIRAFCEDKKSGEALCLIRDMLDGKCVPDSSLCCKVIDALCEDGKVEDACEIWRTLLRKNVMPDNSISSTLIYWLCKAGKVWKARKLFDEFVRGFIPSVMTYNTLISGMCENGELKEAAVLWDDMVGRKCYPNLFTYNVLISGFCKAGNPKEGVRVMEEMLQKGCVPNKFTYGVLLDGLYDCEHQDEEALNILGEAASCGFLDEKNWAVFVRKVTTDTGTHTLGKVLNT